ncbi:hypothetical protein RCL_jg15034.t1 [Rhizophagus clarus]|uniref:Uncharacterized protein n=1 Tax=Rhizophagus clarus TaxID=94130 RepID=A0A8H3M2K2_9GLOM|nr:hypothetical protein RCL_jg15034.t1 [Rhizophagus clarus]
MGISFIFDEEDVIHFPKRQIFDDKSLWLLICQNVRPEIGFNQIKTLPHSTCFTLWDFESEVMLKVHLLRQIFIHLKNFGTKNPFYCRKKSQFPFLKCFPELL